MRASSRVQVAAFGIAMLTAFAPCRAADAAGSHTPSRYQLPRGVVLIAHVTGGAVARNVATAAREDNLPVRHDLTQLHAVSVRVTPAQVASTVARLRALPGVHDVETAVVRQLSSTPDDPGYGSQSRYLDAVDAPAAWSRQQGSSSVRIAVIDSGVDTAHPDLSAQIVDPHNIITATSDVTDTVGHGTFVAGVAAATTDNGIGVAGAGWNTSIMPVKVAAADGSVTVDDEAAGIIWAVDHGADIINLSLGGYTPSATEKAAVDYALGKGVLVVAAAGNEATDDRSYPAAYPGVIAVGATDAGGHRAEFSDHGSWVTLAAPGTNIYSTAPTSPSTLFANTTSYAFASGTSFSAPLVAGEAALLAAADPGVSRAMLRAALVRSAHGNAHLGLGAGQVDFAAALDYVAPISRPTAVTVTGDRAVLRFAASSRAADVSFRVDGAAWSKPVAVSAGHAALRFTSYGYANSTHTLAVADCSSHGECNTGRPSSATFPLVNQAPTLTAPSEGAAVTGLFDVDATSPGGGVEFRIDGATRAFDARAPYTQRFSGSALTDGRHTVQARQCSSDGTRCGGPLSAPVTITSRSLHPSIVSVLPARFSPNRDRSKDTTTITFTLARRQDASIRVYDARGALVRGPIELGSLAAGRHLFLYRGGSAKGRPLSDGSYSLELNTAADAATIRGSVTAPVHVDTVRARLGSVIGRGAKLYPRPDGYADRFRPSVTVSEPATLTLTVRTASGHVVHRGSVYAHTAGRVALSWYGHDRAGRFARSGTYRWTLSAVDRAGNTSSTPSYRLYLSERRLDARTVTVRANASSAYSAGTTDPSCGYAGTAYSTYPHGLYLIQSCDPNRDATQISSAQYRFTLPYARRYGALSLETRGSSYYTPARLEGTFYRVGSSAATTARYLTVTSGRKRTYYLGSVDGPGYVDARHVVRVAVALDNRFAANNVGASDFDLDQVVLKMTYYVLA